LSKVDHLLFKRCTLASLLNLDIRVMDEVQVVGLHFWSLLICMPPFKLRVATTLLTQHRCLKFCSLNVSLLAVEHLNFDVSSFERTSSAEVR